MKLNNVFKLIIICFIGLLIGCKEKSQPVNPVEEEDYISFYESKITINLGEEVDLDIISNYDGEFDYEVSSSIIKVENNKVIGLFPGNANVIASFEGKDGIVSAKLKVTVIGEKKLSDCYVRFLKDSMDIKVGEKVLLEYETDYPYQLLFTNTTNISVVDDYLTVNTDGVFEIKAYFIVDGISYGDSITVTVKYDDTYYNVTIDDETYECRAGTRLRDFLTKIYNGSLYSLVPGESTDGYYFDNEYQNKVDYNYVINSDIELFCHKYFEEFTFPVNKIIGYNSSFAFDDDIVCVSPSTDLKLYNLPLDDYKCYTIKYSLDVDEYVVFNRNQRSLPADGFLLCVKNGSEYYDKIFNILQEGCKVYLDSYTINKTKNITINKTLETNLDTIAELDVSCQFGAIYDATNHQFLYKKQEHKLAYPASTTKIVTAITALKICPLDYEYTSGAELDLCYQGDSPSVAGYSKGETFTLRDYLYMMMLPSGNDAAYSVAACAMSYLMPESTATMRGKIDTFARLMNGVAQEVGAKGSHFMVPDGNAYYNMYGEWDERAREHYVTAYDMCLFANYAFRFGAIAQICGTYYTTVRSSKGMIYSLNNTNSLLGSYPGACGLKTGTTGAAGYCLIGASFRTGRLIITASMKSKTRNELYTDTTKMMNAAFKK